MPAEAARELNNDMKSYVKASDGAPYGFRCYQLASSIQKLCMYSVVWLITADRHRLAYQSRRSIDSHRTSTWEVYIELLPKLSLIMQLRSVRKAPRQIPKYRPAAHLPSIKQSPHARTFAITTEEEVSDGSIRKQSSVSIDQLQP